MNHLSFKYLAALEITQNYSRDGLLSSLFEIHALCLVFVMYFFFYHDNALCLEQLWKVNVIEDGKENHCIIESWIMHVYSILHKHTCSKLEGWKRSNRLRKLDSQSCDELGNRINKM